VRKPHALTTEQTLSIQINDVEEDEFEMPEWASRTAGDVLRRVARLIRILITSACVRLRKGLPAGQSLPIWQLLRERPVDQGRNSEELVNSTRILVKSDHLSFDNY
jgi:hypothetical protein